jgi:hypothetical protein
LTHSWGGPALLVGDTLDEPSRVPATASGEPPPSDGVVPADVAVLGDALPHDEELPDGDALPEDDELGDGEPDEADGSGEPVPGPADGSLVLVGDGAGDCEPGSAGEGEALGASAAQD